MSELIFKVDIATQEEQYDFLVERLFKECETKNGYIGVEYDNIYISNLQDEYDTFSEVLFHRIFIEMEALSDHGHELVRDEYDEDLPFRSEYNVMQHVKRLGKFIVKYAPRFFSEDRAERHIKEAKRYL